MSVPSQPVKGTLEMIASMRATLSEKRYVYTQTTWEALLPLLPTLQMQLHSITAEPEGVSLLVEVSAVPDPLPAAPDSPELAHILLQVHSSLEGVGLTAAVAQSLTEAKIACNVVAGLNHDHVFVPVADAARAIVALERISNEAQKALDGI